MHPAFGAVASYTATLFCGGLVVAVPAWWRGRRRRQAVEDRLLGRAAVTDKNGVEITPKVASVHEEIADLRADLLARPALNGEWSHMRADVAWTRSAVERHLADPKAHDA